MSNEEDIQDVSKNKNVDSDNDTRNGLGTSDSSFSYDKRHHSIEVCIHNFKKRYRGVKCPTMQQTYKWIRAGKKTSNSPKTTRSNRRVKINDYLLTRLKEHKQKCQKFVGFENSWYIFGCLNPLSTTTVERKKE